MVSKHGSALVDGSGTRDDPLTLLSRIHQSRSFYDLDEKPWPGMVMALSYDLKDSLEPTSALPQPDTSFPDIVGMAHDIWAAVDHSQGETWVLGMNHDRRSDFKARFESFCQRLSQAVGAPKTAAHSVRAGTSDMGKTAYLQAFRQVQEALRRGDVYQANLTRRLTAQLSGDPLSLYLRLRERSPSPFGCFLEFADQAILCASPERFVRIEKGRVETCPIKGTRRRSPDAAEDRRLQDELLASDKDKAELTMIVDLCRNDLARFCQPGSIKVDDLRRLETHAGVHHTVATVSGQPPWPWHFADLVRAVFPGGSITGAPKVAAMKLLAALEPARRAFYTGSIFVADAAGRLDSNILIRTLLCDHSQLSFQVGGGVVIDSDAEAEWEETSHKASSLFDTLGLLESEFT
ncbi:MAG: anthranilate synthase component I family protein [Planctomycetota bacterium]